MPVVVPAVALGSRAISRTALRAGLIGAVVGGVAAFIRPFIPGMIHWDAIGGIAALTAYSFVLALRPRRVLPARDAHLLASAPIIAAWVGFCGGVVAVSQEVREFLLLETLGMTGLFGGATLITGNGLLILVQRLRPPELGRFCPNCHYDLRGTTGPRCSECGQAIPAAEPAPTAAVSMEMTRPRD